MQLNLGSIHPNTLHPQLNRLSQQPIHSNTLHPQLNRLDQWHIYLNALHPQLNRLNQRPIHPNTLHPQLNRLNQWPKHPNALHPQLNRLNQGPIHPDTLHPIWKLYSWHASVSNCYNKTGCLHMKLDSFYLPLCLRLTCAVVCQVLLTLTLAWCAGFFTCLSYLIHIYPSSVLTHSGFGLFGL